MKLNLKRFLVFAGLSLFIANFGYSAENMCKTPSPESDKLYKLLVNSTYKTEHEKDAFLLDEAICKKPESVFQYEFKSNTKGLIKIQAVCNVINIYTLNDSKAHDEVFGKIGMAVDPMMSLLFSMMTNTSVKVMAPTKVSPGILDTDYGDSSSYEFIHRDDEAHKQKHLSKLEAQDSHCHIAHKKSLKIDEGDITKIANALYRTGIITSEERTDFIETFTDF